MALWRHSYCNIRPSAAIWLFKRKSRKTKNRNSWKNRWLKRNKRNAKKERESLRLATENRTKYILELESAENEIKILRARDAAGTSKLRVKATCASLPTTATNPAGSSETTPELTTDARTAYFDLRREMTQCPAQLNLCIKTLQDDRR